MGVFGTRPLHKVAINTGGGPPVGPVGFQDDWSNLVDAQALIDRSIPLGSYGPSVSARDPLRTYSVSDTGVRKPGTAAASYEMLPEPGSEWGTTVGRLLAQTYLANTTAVKAWDGFVFYVCTPNDSSVFGFRLTTQRTAANQNSIQWRLDDNVNGSTIFYSGTFDKSITTYNIQAEFWAKSPTLVRAALNINDDLVLPPTDFVVPRVPTSTRVHVYSGIANASQHSRLRYGKGLRYGEDLVLIT